MNLKLNRAFDYFPATNLGIFHYLQSLDVPWQENNIATKLDFYYHLNHSGNKITSPLIDSFIDESTHKISTGNIQELANIIYALFGQTWSRMWDVYNAEYNPINNYDMTETYEETRETEYGKTQTRTDDLTEERTDDLTEERTDNLSETRTDNLTDQRTDNLTDERTDDLTEERTDDLTQLETPAQTKDTSESVYGFNSTDPEPSREISEVNGGTFTRDQDGTVTTEKTGTETTTHTGTETTTHTGTETTANTGKQTRENTGTQTRENTGTQTLADTGTDTVETGHTLTRLGNIGVTTSQQMLQSEIDLWQWNFFKNVVFPNVDGVLTISLY